jgi:hypothetical protein
MEVLVEHLNDIKDILKDASKYQKTFDYPARLIIFNLETNNSKGDKYVDEIEKALMIRGGDKRATQLALHRSRRQKHFLVCL